MQGTGDLAPWSISQLKAWKTQTTSIYKGTLAFPPLPMQVAGPSQGPHAASVPPAVPKTGQGRSTQQSPRCPWHPPPLAAALPSPSPMGQDALCCPSYRWGPAQACGCPPGPPAHSPAHIRPRLPDPRHRLCMPPSLSPGPGATHPHRDPSGGDNDCGAQARLLLAFCPHHCLAFLPATTHLVPVPEGPTVMVGTVLEVTAGSRPSPGAAQGGSVSPARLGEGNGVPSW